MRDAVFCPEKRYNIRMMSVVSRAVFALSRVFCVAAVAVMASAPLALAQDDSRPANRLEEKMDLQGERLDALAAKTDRLTERVDGLAAKVEKLTESVTKLSENVAVLTERMVGLTDKVNEQGEDIDWMKTALWSLVVAIIAGLLGVIGVDRWKGRKPASDNSTAEGAMVRIPTPTSQNPAVEFVPNELANELVNELFTRALFSMSHKKSVRDITPSEHRKEA